MIAGGEKNMMGLSELEDRQTDRHRQELLCLLVLDFFHLLVLDFFHFMMGL